MSNMARPSLLLAVLGIVAALFFSAWPLAWGRG